MYTVNTKINNQLSFWLITMFIIISIMISLNNQIKIRFNTEMRIEYIEEKGYL